MALFLHGGGYVRGSLAPGRIVASGVAALAGAPVFSAAYRQAPEARFPAAFDDAAAAYDGPLAHGFTKFAIDASAVAIGLVGQQLRALGPPGFGT